MLHIWICDDEKMVVDYLEEQLQQQSEEVILQSFLSGDEILQKLDHTEEYPDIVFLDIEIGKDTNGIDLGNEIQQRVSHVALILMTGYIDYARDIFKSRPVYFLVKPFQEDKISEAFRRAQEFLADGGKKDILLKSSGKLVKINSDRILYAEKNLRKVDIVTEEETYPVYTKIEELRKKLPDNFTVCHKSFLVNLNEIAYFSPEGLTLNNGVELPVSRSKYKKAKEDFMHHFNKYE